MCWVMVPRVIQCSTENNEWEAQGTVTGRLEAIPSFLPALIHPVYS